MGLRGGFVREVERLRIVFGRELEHFLARDFVAAKARPGPDFDIFPILHASDLLVVPGLIPDPPSLFTSANEGGPRIKSGVTFRGV
jgi:hypothetical protein